MRAVIAEKGGNGTVDQSGDYLADGAAERRAAVLVRHATLKDEDAPPTAARPPVLRRFPMVGGIDFSSFMEFSGRTDAKTGANAALNRFGLANALPVGHAGLGWLAEDRDLTTGTAPAQTNPFDEAIAAARLIVSCRVRGRAAVKTGGGPCMRRPQSARERR